MIYAPIALFVYNRPAHTRRTVEALQKNALADESDLIIYSDAPKNTATEEAVREVREYIRAISGFKSVSIIERDKNWGLANSIIDGVTTVVNERGRIIVLEDDLVTSPYFLGYMNNALDMYKNDEKVMHISGYMFPIDVTGLQESIFLRNASCWGWATWDRAWKYFENDSEKLLVEFSEQSIYRFNLDDAKDFWMQVEENSTGILNTWAIFWYASVFRNGGLCLHPKFSMVNNIGHDESGVHCSSSDMYAVQLASKPITYFEPRTVEDAVALSRLKAFYIPPTPSLITRVMLAMKRRVLKS